MRTFENVIKVSIEELDLYQKNNDIEVYYLESLEVFPKGTQITIPTLEGDVEIISSPEQYIMIGPCNDIYPISKELFNSKYIKTGQSEDSQIIDNVRLMGWDVRTVNKCKLVNSSYVYAKEIPFEFDVYVKHCDSVIHGNAGDFYAVSYEDLENNYIIQADIMRHTYDKID